MPQSPTPPPRPSSRDAAADPGHSREHVGLRPLPPGAQPPPAPGAAPRPSSEAAPAADGDPRPVDVASEP